MSTNSSGEKDVIIETLAVGQDDCMNPEVSRSKLFLSTAILFLLGTTLPLVAQVRSPIPAPSPGQIVKEPSPSPELPESQAEPTPLYGFQGVLVETIKGEVVAEQAVDQSFNPASAIKLATALVALKVFGPQHRFITGIWTDGTLDKTTGTIQGDLYISGRDPSLGYEHAIAIAQHLNALGIRAINGDLIVAPGFTLNYNPSAQASGDELFDTLDSLLRPPAATRSWMEERVAQNAPVSLESVPSVSVMGGVYVGTVPSAAKQLFLQQSQKLVEILKLLLCYSNNFMAERIGESVGGKAAVSRYLTNDLGISPEEVRLSSVSGLGINRVTPRAMMKILKALRDELRSEKLSLTDIMPVAGVDQGTLKDRFVSLEYRGSVVAKTGTLARTDGGVSSLVGEMGTANGGILLFVIFNQQGNVSRFRENQDAFVMQIQQTRGGPKAFDYTPPKQTLHAAVPETTKSASSKAEFAPRSSN